MTYRQGPGKTRLFISAALLPGCGGMIGLVLLVAALFAPAAAPPMAESCPNSAKIAFTQETGCLNDDSFEFCIPANDTSAMQAVRVLAPGTSCGAGRGRAQCKDGQLLCMVPTSGLCDPNMPDALNDDGWQVACALADQPFIDAIVPTWYE